MLVLDTTVLVYAKGADHPLREPSRRLLELVSTGSITATTTPEVIQEFTHFRARRRDLADAVGLARDFAELLSPLLVVDRGALDRGLDLLEVSEGLGTFDAVLAATTIEAEASGLVSADRVFSRIGGLGHLPLDGVELESMLR